jgi:phosphoribosylformimino-5-aminoimidazole carboxamide ribotide isomerase
LDLYPAIDIQRGRVVRLSQGEATRQTVYGNDPAGVAERFAGEGAGWLHVVDLDRAFGDGDNDPAIRGILERVGARMRVQLGGGIRSLDRLQQALALGAARVVVGTAAVTEPGFVAAAVALAAPDRLAVGIDARDGMVAIRGWTETASLRAADLARRVVAEGVTTLIYTDVARDGMLGGPDLRGAVALQGQGARVIASGGVSSRADVRAACEAGLAGAIVGRALYEGRLGLREALEAARCGSPSP